LGFVADFGEGDDAGGNEERLHQFDPILPLVRVMTRVGSFLMR